MPRKFNITSVCVPHLHYYVIIFRDEKFVVELKLWRGEEYHRQGIVRLKDYMQREGAQKGFMLIMDKIRHKEFTSETDDDILMVWI